MIGGKLEWSDLENNPPTRQNFDILDWEDLIEKFLKREAMEECGLEVRDLKYLDNVVFLRPDKIPVVCFKFGVKYKSGEVDLAPEFDDFKWVDEEEVKTFRSVQGIDKEVAQTIDLFQTEN